MVKTPSFKCLILRAVLRQVSPMVIRLVSVSDQMELHEFGFPIADGQLWNAFHNCPVAIATPFQEDTDSDYLFSDCSQRAVSWFCCGKSSVIKQTL
jgi:hypothetical protein